MDNGRSMRAVKNNLPTPSAKVEESEVPCERGGKEQRGASFCEGMGVRRSNEPVLLFAERAR